MIQIIKDIAALVVALTAYMLAAERDGDGEQKKEEVIVAMQETIEDYGRDRLPNWVISILKTETVLSVLLELKYTALKRADFLQ